MSIDTKKWIVKATRKYRVDRLFGRLTATLDAPNAFSPSCLVLACVADGWIVMAAASGGCLVKEAASGGCLVKETL